MLNNFKINKLKNLIDYLQDNKKITIILNFLSVAIIIYKVSLTFYNYMYREQFRLEIMSNEIQLNIR